MKKFACMYLRLSREDGDSTESNSISNQRQIIKSYARDNDFKVVAEYVDDGFQDLILTDQNLRRWFKILKRRSLKQLLWRTYPVLWERLYRIR